MITKNYIKMCEKAPRELWNKQSKNSRIGTLMAWRSFLGIVVPCPKREKRDQGDIINFIPETLVMRTWLKDDEDITILETNVDYCSVDPDKGTPVYAQEQLQDMIDCDWYKVFSKFLWWHSDSDENAEEFASMFYSMNEVWLAFVMKEKWNKEWNGDDWK